MVKPTELDDCAFTYRELLKAHKTDVLRNTPLVPGNVLTFSWAKKNVEFSAEAVNLFLVEEALEQ